MNMGEGKGHHLDMPMAILQKIVLGNTKLQVGLPDMEGVHPLQAMEDDLHQGRHPHPEDMADSLQGLRQHLEAIGLHLEVMELTLCRVEIFHLRDRKPH